mmetsp:Transcript_35073/g.40532  ORF Transcript_35073/g.40532 Transcript_35073/m.40532 type:complete len:93 (-) Transcript_35073:54-332(-)
MQRQNSAGPINNSFGSKATLARANSSYRPDDLNRNRMGTMYPAGMVDPMGGMRQADFLDESSDSDSESSNSSVGSNEDFAPNTMNKNLSMQA